MEKPLKRAIKQTQLWRTEYGALVSRCPGGKMARWQDGIYRKMAFIASMIEESVEFADQCRWFSSLVSKKDNLKSLYKILVQARVADVKTIDMAQGQKVSRFIVWSFTQKSQRRL